jgi:hypothetical protein
MGVSERRCSTSVAAASDHAAPSRRSSFIAGSSLRGLVAPGVEAAPPRTVTAAGRQGNARARRDAPGLAA